MKWNTGKWREDAGSIDFIQIIIGLMITSIAAVGTFQALNYGNDRLNYQMRYRKAMSIARSHVEYWQGRIHTDFDEQDARMRAGNLNRPVAPTLLDEGDPLRDEDDVECFVRYGKIDPVDLQRTGAGLDYWVINVEVTWWELGELEENPNMEPHRVTFNGTMVPAAL